MIDDEDTTPERPLATDPEMARELDIMFRAQRLVEGLTPEELHGAIMHAVGFAGGGERMGAWGEAWNAVAAALQAPVPSMWGQAMPDEKAWAAGACAASLDEWRARLAPARDKEQAERRRLDQWLQGERRWAEGLREQLARTNPRFRELPRSYILRTAAQIDRDHRSTLEAAWSLAAAFASRVGLQWTRDAIKQAHKRLK